MNTADTCGGGSGACHCEEPSSSGSYDGEIGSGTCVE